METAPHRALAFRRADNEQKATTTWSRPLAAGRTGVERAFDLLIDQLVRHAGCELSLGFPADPDRATQGLNVSAAQTFARGGCQVAQAVQLGKSAGDVGRLFVEDRVGAPGHTGVEEHDLPLERPAVEQI